MKQIILLALSTLILTANQANVKDVNKTKTTADLVQEIMKKHKLIKEAKVRMAKKDEELKKLRKLRKVVDKVVNKLGIE